MCITLTGKLKLKGKCTITPSHESLKESYVNCLKSKVILKICHFEFKFENVKNEILSLSLKSAKSTKPKSFIVKNGCNGRESVVNIVLDGSTFLG